MEEWCLCRVLSRILSSGLYKVLSKGLGTVGACSLGNVWDFVFAQIVSDVIQEIKLRLELFFF